MSKRGPKRGHGGKPRKKNTPIKAYWRQMKRKSRDKKKVEK